MQHNCCSPCMISIFLMAAKANLRGRRIAGPGHWHSADWIMAVAVLLAPSANQMLPLWPLLGTLRLCQLVQFRWVIHFRPGVVEGGHLKSLKASLF